jgi:cytoskeletal protein CcmA (bactofilin family)
MFKKVKKDTNKPASTRDLIGGGKEKPQPVSGAGKDAQTVIGEPFTIEGSIQGEENFILEGSMNGRVELERHFFMVGSKGRFDGEVFARDVIVKGRLKGRINAEGNIKIAKGAEFFGEVKSQTISIEGGALVKAVFEIARKPSPKQAEKRTPEVGRQSAMPSSQPRKGN